MYQILPAQNSWQWTKKLGCNSAYDFELPQVMKTLMDSKGNQYIAYYITGDTFYYGTTYKRYIAGGDGFALCKVRCDGSLAWCKIITHGRKNKADLTSSNFNTLFFGKDENNILISAGISIYSSNYIDTDTTLGNNINGYTIIYDSTGVAKKKIVNKSNQLGLSFASGYFSRTNQYVNGAHIDSTATNRVFFNGKYLSTGEYLIFLDTNFNYSKIVPFVNFSKPFAQWDSTQPIYYFNSNILPMCQTFGTKLVFYSAVDFNPTSYSSPLLTPKFFVIGRDTIRAKDMPRLDQFVIYSCYNDTGGQEWTRFCYFNAGATGNPPNYFEFDKIKKEISIKRDDDGSLKFQNQNINSIAPSGNYQTNIFNIDSNGNFLWQKGIEHDAMGAGMYNTLSAYHNSKSELIINLAVQSISSGTHYGVYINGKRIQDNTNGYNNKNILVAVSKDSIRIIDTNTDATRNTLIKHLTVDPSDNIYVHGIKKINGCIIDNDSSAIDYAVGQDNFIAKYGKANCTCDPIKSAYKALDSTTDGRITLQYTGLPSDSVRYLWDDGTWSVAKPSTTATTKIYNQTKTVMIKCVSYNSCGQTDTFKKTYQIKCTTLTSRFILTDSNNKSITAQYTGTTTDSVRFLWGDGNSAWVTNPSTKLMNYTYTTLIDSIKISAIVKNKCGQSDTFSRWYKFCTKPVWSLYVDSSLKHIRKLTVQYQGALTDSFKAEWGDGTISTDKIQIKTFANNGLYTMRFITKSKCGRLDTLIKTMYLGTVSIQSTAIQNLKIYPNPAKDKVMVEFSDNFHFKDEIQFYNALGRQLDLFQNKMVKNKCIFDVSVLTVGIYFLKIEGKYFKIQIER